MTQEAEVLAANQNFYEAFGAGDTAAMEALWARRAPVACTHPGWTALTERQQILDSWANILEGSSVKVACLEAQVHLLAEVAFVTCNEAVGNNLLAATNVFVREDGAWRIVHHHASPIARSYVKRGPGRDDPVH